jgi:hypothetical protein
LIILKFFSSTNAHFMLQFTIKTLFIRSYMFRPIWTILREPMPILAKVTLSWIYQ